MSDWIKATDPILDFSERWVKPPDDELTLVAENFDRGSTLFLPVAPKTHQQDPE